MKSFLHERRPFLQDTLLSGIHHQFSSGKQEQMILLQDHHLLRVLLIQGHNLPGCFRKAYGLHLREYKELFPCYGPQYQWKNLGQHYWQDLQYKPSSKYRRSRLHHQGRQHLESQLHNRCRELLRALLEALGQAVRGQNQKKSPVGLDADFLFRSRCLFL